MLYTSLDNAAIAYDRHHEKIALEEVGKAKNMEIRKWGLFIDQNLPYLGASPDRLIESNGIVEVKCPSSAEKMTPHEAACKGKARYLKYDKNHK